MRVWRERQEVNKKRRFKSILPILNVAIDVLTKEIIELAEMQESLKSGDLKEKYIQVNSEKITLKFYFIFYFSKLI